jgi:large subunit ribosomal protein L9
MKVFLLKDVEKIGMAGEIIKVADGFAVNFLLPRKLALLITSENEASFSHRLKTLEKRQEVIATKTSMLAEKIKSLELVLRRKMHEGDKLYGSVTSQEIVSLLGEKGISITKNQVEFEKSIKTKGSYSIIIKLSTKLKPHVLLKVVTES